MKTELITKHITVQIIFLIETLAFRNSTINL